LAADKNLLQEIKKLKQKIVVLKFCVLTSRLISITAVFVFKRFSISFRLTVFLKGQ
jgi:hypothetical protein